MKLSIVSTLYCSSDYVLTFYQRSSSVAREQFGEDYEIVFVNDGSPDNSLSIAVELTRADPHVVVVDLSRNFGHHKAMMTGMSYAEGDCVFLIDSDLEEDPEWLAAFHGKLTSDHCDVVYGVQKRRKGRWFERWTGELFYRLIPAISDIDMPKSMVTARLMSRRYVDALLMHDEREIDIGGLWVITGFDQRPYPVDKQATSQTTYSFAKRIALVVNSITSFSSVPLVAVFYIGVALFTLTCAYTTFVIVQWMFLAQPVSGWTSLILSVWLLGGVIISCLGVIGIYLAKMFMEVKRRPNTIVREVYGR